MSDTTSLKFPRSGDKADIESGVTFQPLFNSDGLLPAIVTEHGSRQVLMFAWMNEAALSQTLETGRATFWSRSRKELWQKGEESGNTLTVAEIRTDCDQDVLLLSVTMGGDKVACHTGAKSCFYRQVSYVNAGNGGYNVALTHD